MSEQRTMFALHTNPEFYQQDGLYIAYWNSMISMSLLRSFPFSMNTLYWSLVVESSRACQIWSNCYSSSVGTSRNLANSMWWAYAEDIWCVCHLWFQTSCQPFEPYWLQENRLLLLHYQWSPATSSSLSLNIEYTFYNAFLKSCFSRRSTSFVVSY